MPFDSSRVIYIKLASTAHYVYWKTQFFFLNDLLAQQLVSDKLIRDSDEKKNEDSVAETKKKALYPKLKREEGERTESKDLRSRKAKKTREREGSSTQGCSANRSQD